MKRIRCLRENAFRELEEPKGSLHHASNSFIENSDSCEGWKCKRMDLNFHFPSWKSPHGGKLSQFPWKKKLHFSHAVTPPAVTIWALTFFNRFNGYLMLWKISEPVSRISTYKGNSWGTSKSTFFSTNKIHLPPCWKFLKGTLGPPFLLKSAIVTCCLKLNHLHFPNNSITHGMSKTSVKALNNIRAISVQGQFLLKKIAEGTESGKKSKPKSSDHGSFKTLCSSKYLCTYIYIYINYICVYAFLGSKKKQESQCEMISQTMKFSENTGMQSIKSTRRSWPSQSDIIDPSEIHTWDSKNGHLRKGWVYIFKKNTKNKKNCEKKATKQTPRLAKNVQQNQTKKKTGVSLFVFFFSRLRERTEPRRGPGHLVPTCKGPSRSLWMQREQWLYPRVTGWGEVTVEVELGGSLYNTHTHVAVLLESCSIFCFNTKAASCGWIVWRD